MALSARAKLQGANVLIRAPYDPMRIYARMAKFYRWSFEEMQNMHFVTFFAFVREADEMNREEQAIYDRHNHGATQAASGEGLFVVAEPYEGETVAI